ncbi:XPG-I domain, partial [Trinorchestia longiramus]
MGVKNLWSILSSTGEVIAFGSPGAPVLGSSTSNVSKCCGRDKNSDHLHRNASSNCVLEDLSNLNEKLSEMMVSGSDLPFKDPTGQKGQDIQESLTGSAVAVDLACWVCDSQANVNMHSVIKPHLRNLVFRTLSLLSVGVLPVFVVDGVPPELKQATMQARNAARGNSKTVSRRPPKRHQFNSVLRECCELFQLLGVPWVQAAGEAEATCAALLYTGVVKAVITEDSDVLLYGGCCVLRNFSLQTNKPTAELYTQSKILQKLQLDRHALIALSLLLGCDYLPAGVPGVGVASAVTLVTHWGKQGLDALRQLDKWAHTACDRDAPVAKFKKSGNVVELEAAIRDRAVRTPGFPFREVVSEFQKLLCVPEELQHGLSWLQPSVNELVTWCQSKLGWEQNYAISKALQFAGRWYVMHALPTSPSPTGFPLQVEKIVRSCKRGGTMCYEVEWRLSNDTRPPLAQLKSLDAGAASASSPVLVTIEPQNLVALCLPAVERAFQELKLEKKAKARKTKSEGRRPAGQAALDGEKESGVRKGSGVKIGSRGSKNRAASAGSGKQLKLTVTSSKTLALCRSPGIYNVDQEITSRSQRDLKENLFTEVDGVPSHKILPCDQTFADRINVDGPDLRQGCHDAQGLENSSRASCLGWRSSGDSNNASKFYLSPGRLYPSTSSCDFDLSVFEEYDENDDEKDLSLVVDRFIKLNVEERKNQCRSGKQKSSVQESDKSSSNSFSRETQCKSSSRDGLETSESSEIENFKGEYWCEGVTTDNSSCRVLASSFHLEKPGRKMGHNISSPLFSEDGETQSKFHLESTLCSKCSSSRSPFKETEIQLVSLDSDHHRLDDSFVVKNSLFDRANFLLKLKAQRIEHGADQLTNGIPSLKCAQECLDCTSGDEEPEKQVCRQRHRSTNGHILSALPENLVSTSVVDGCEEFEKSSSIDEEVM